MTDAPVCLLAGASGGIASAIARHLAAGGRLMVLMSRSGYGPLAEELGQVVVADGGVNRGPGL